MMLNMSNKYDAYQKSPAAFTAGCSSSSTSAGAAVAAADLADAAKAERESIHSGQFMVSHFEAEEAQDDLDDDGEVKMLDPEDPNLQQPSSLDEPNPCLEVQLYVPRKVTKVYKDGCGGFGGHRGGVGGVDDFDDNSSGAAIVTSHLEIETSLTKLFKCMNLAYSQKLTSPKWNHFKGVRLRWKDKIRLNNVIWRCWHMQFIQKRRTPVCQFASPLDADIHSNPQSVVLEGKYWKRQLAVIKAEYRKWRRNFKSSAAGCLTYDTRSEFDFLEWSPLNDRNLMLSEDWTTDTLFSAINGPFPFPDPREIARGAGIADFIQPSLGPLQPNLDDIDLTFVELLQNSRLPPVPEEGTDEMLKNVDYGFSAIMGAEQMDASNIMDVSVNAAAVNVNSMQSNDDANMMELNTPLNNIQFADIEQQFASRGNENVGLIGRSSGSSDDAIMSDSRSTLMLSEPNSAVNRLQAKHYASQAENTLTRQNSIEFPGKSVIKGRISKSFQRPFRREPHNYDKAQPTLHQTTIYQQMLAEQQKMQQVNHQQQQHLQPNSLVANNVLQQQQLHYQQQQQQQQAQYAQAPSQTTVRSTNNYGGYGSENTSAIAATSSSNLQNINSTAAALAASKSGQVLAAGQLMLNVKIEPPSPDVLSMFNLSTTSAPSDLCDLYTGGGSANAYKPYPSVPNFKKSASTGYINVRLNPNQQLGSGGVGYMQDQSQMTTASATAQPPQMHAQSLPLSMGGQLTVLQQQQQRQVPHTQTQHHSPNSSQQQQLHQQHHLAQQQQQVQQQAAPPQRVMMPHQKEIFRSNSLPLNVSLQKLDARLVGGQQDNFAVPKYHVKSSKARTRSNSIHQHMVVGGNGNGNGSGGVSSNCENVGSSSSGSLLVSQQLQAATSDPMLNSTLAQLLTNSCVTSLGKQQSSSTSAISSLNMPMTTTSSSSVGPSTMSVPSKSPQTIVVPATAATNFFMTTPPTQSSSSSSSLLGVAITSAQEMLQRQHAQLKHQQHQQKSPKKSTSLPTPVKVHSPPPGNKMLSYPPPSGHAGTFLSLSPDSFHDQDSPLSPTHSLKIHRGDNQRRAGHIHAEQKRRYNIKNGFDMLHSLIPQLQQNPNAKLSKAAMLQKGADHIKHLRTERNLLKDKMEALRKERDALNNSLTHLQSILPANGAPVTRQGTEHVRQLYEQYVRYRTMNNWKFWILGLILEPLLTSYTASVSSASMEELRRTAFLWVDQHCSLIDLRPAVSNKLKYLSMKTDILSDPPSMLQEEVAKAVHNTTGQHPNLHGT